MRFSGWGPGRSIKRREGRVSEERIRIRFKPWLILRIRRRVATIAALKHQTGPLSLSFRTTNSIPCIIVLRLLQSSQVFRFPLGKVNLAVKLREFPD